MTSELDRTRGELLRLQEERAAAAPAVATGQGGEETAELWARLEHLEGQRQQEIAELQRAQESLANTQVELMDANRKLRSAEDRMRELEMQALRSGSAAQEPAPVAGPGDVPPEWSTTPPADEIPPHRRPAPEPSAAPESMPGDEEAAEEEEPAEPLSLRERLARAAAARHRTSQPPE